LRVQRLRTTGFAAVGAAALVAAMIAATPSSAGAAGTQTQQVRVAKQVCASANATHRSCDAMRVLPHTVTIKTAQKLAARGYAVSPAAGRRIGSGPAGGYSPAQLVKAYGLNPNAKNPAKIAIVDAFDDPSVRSDLNFFDKNYGLPKETSKSFKVVNQSGNASPLPTNDPGWASEETLDVQTVRGICHTCQILLVETNNNNNPNLAAGVNQAVKMGYKIVSNSYGGPESHGQQSAYNHKGVAILASTGDSGWYDWTGFNGGVSASDVAQTPAAFPSVIGVGGTSLYTNPDSSHASESVWNDNGIADIPGSFIAEGTGGAYLPGAAGSGCSTVFTPKSWQKAAKGYGKLGCGSHSSEVDIAALADPFTGYDIYCTTGCTGVFGPGWSTFGGTSLASPLVAAMWGLAGGPAKGTAYPEQTLYNNYKAHPGDTHDIVEGGTGACYQDAPANCVSFFGTNPNTIGAGRIDCAWDAAGKRVSNVGQCYAETGYDGVSGVGAPKGVAIFK
jgi:subtilase family serine protease